MGILSDTKGRKQVLNVLSKHHIKLCVLSYVAGIVWLCALSDRQLNNRTYFSENALLPGMVNDDYYNHKLASTLYGELKSMNNPQTVPLAWLEEKMKDYGLHTYRQNFTVQIPFPDLNGPSSIEGTNLYGVYRAPRIAGTEAMVLSVPYKKGNNMGALALMLSLADHCRRYSYWSKDIIFLVTEEGVLGMQAWVDAYYASPNPYIKSSPVESHSGAIQSAINLEMPSDAVNHVDILIEGLNGQLPNLDIINMVLRVLGKNGVPAALLTQRYNDQFSELGSHAQELVSMIKMMLNQASGLPTGNHGLFHKYRVEAVTLRAVEDSQYYRHGFSEMGRAVEGIYRSLNNLLERFHQSFFFYLLPAPERYVSIGLYIPAMCCLLLCPLLTAIVLWALAGDNSPPEAGIKEDTSVDHPDDQAADTKTGEADTKTEEADTKTEEADTKTEEADTKKVAFTLVPPRVGSVLPVIMAGYLCGYVLYYSPYLGYEVGVALGSDPLATSIWCFACASIVILLLPFSLRLFSVSDLVMAGGDLYILKCAALILHAVMLASIAAINFSLAFFMAVFTIPAFIFASPTKNSCRRLSQLALLILSSPPALLFHLCLVYNVLSADHQLDVATMATITIETAQRALIGSLRDSHLLGTYSFPVGCLAVLPNWSLFWYLAWQ